MKIYKEKDGSYTVNVNEGEITMSTRSFGMVGKSYTSASEAFKDYKYAIAIEKPEKSEYSHLWAVLGAVTALVIVAVLFSRF